MRFWLLFVACFAFTSCVEKLEELKKPEIVVSHPIGNKIVVDYQFVRFSGKAWDSNGITKEIQLIVNGEVVGAVDKSPYEFIYEFTPFSVNEVHLKAIDNHNQSAISPMLTVIIKS